MTVKVEVGKKGYIIIPKSIRELVGIKEGDVLTLTVENGRIVLEPERRVSLSEVAKRLREHEERVRKYAKEARLGDLVGVSLEEEFE
ncbi:MAG: looped-hinge helix DNA binding domain, AbrB family [uncultured Acidilobus sp. JCHS]|nr:MAG: looped-hinge helix DNA binding domain, AbrB family [uncultured Acidilobus sp. JCHS]